MSSNKARKRNIKLILRIFISLVIVVFLLCNANVKETLKVLYGIDHKVWFLGIGFYVTGQIISAYKWKLFAEAAGFRNKLKKYFDYYFTGMFFNLFLPTTVGGDVTRCYYLAKGAANGRKSPAVYSVLAERLTGVAIIVWMATITMFSPVGNIIPVYIKLVMVFFSLSILIITPIFPKALFFFFKKKKLARKIIRDLKVYWTNPKLLFRTLYLSLMFHILIIAIHIIIGQSLGLNIPFMYYFIAYPMAAMAGFIPFTFNGIGPREGAYVYFLSLIGIKAPMALAFSIVWFGIVLCSSLIGGIFYIKGKHNPPPEEFEPDFAS